MNKLLEVDNLAVGYDNKPDVIKHVSFAVCESDFLGIIGPNGGGKTTLLRAILGLVKPSEGNIRFFEKGEVVPYMNIGYLPQITKIDRKFPISVFDIILSGIPPRRSLFNISSKADRDKVYDIADKMGVTHLLNRSVGELSGGQLQRVLLGRAIVDTPPLLILDEPNSYVDKLFEVGFYKLLSSINDQMAIILVSHDVGTIVPMVKNVACVNQHLHYHSGSDISSEWLEKNFTAFPVEIINHATIPHRILKGHDDCDCQK